MSSSKFSVSLAVDRDGHHAVAGLALFATLAGLLFIILMPLPGWQRAAAVLAWLATAGMEAGLWWRSARCCRRLRWAGDGWHGLDRNGIWWPLAPAAGSRSGRHFAWLRFVRSDGRRVTCLLRAAATSPGDWRRLRAISRLSGA